MSDRTPASRPPHAAPEPMQCPHCGEVTLPNLLDDGSCVCSCGAERELPVPGGLPAPMDEP